MLWANMNNPVLHTEISVLHRGAEEARRNESSFLALDTTPKTNLLHALRGPGCPLRGRRQIFLASQTWEPGSVLYRGALMTLLLDLLQCLKTFGSNAEGRRLFFLFAFWVFAEIALQLASLSNIHQISGNCLNYCLVGFISLFSIK